MHWPAESLWEQLEPAWPGLTVEVRAEVDSTNARLTDQARSGDWHPTVLVAERQTAGRGRLGRAWLAPAGGSLAFSVGVPLAPKDWSGLSLAVGVAVAEALHPDVRVKWPNDLWTWGADGRPAKLGGILIETSSLPPSATGRWVVVGVGLNVSTCPEGPFAVAPAALDRLVPGLTPQQTLERVLPAILAALRAFEAAGFGVFGARFAARDALAGRVVRALAADGSVQDGVARGVTAEGGLMLHPEGLDPIVVTSADVSIRPC